MGYRSDVVIVAGTEAYQKILTTCHTADFLPDVDRQYKDGCHLMRWEDVKWYDDFEEVIAVTECLQSLNDVAYKDESNGYVFMRKGEDLEDTEWFSNTPGCWIPHQPSLQIAVDENFA